MSFELDAALLVAYSSHAMIATGIAVFFLSLYIRAPFGRYSSNSWGPLLDARFAWVLMETPTLWSVALLYYFYFGVPTSFADLFLEGQLPLTNKILLGCFLLHYTQRSFVYPLFRMNKSSAPMPVGVMLSAWFYCLWNGLTQGAALLVVHKYPDSWLSSSRFSMGMGIFFCGFFLNIQADSILLNLRKTGEARRKKLDGGAVATSNGGGKQYYIPEGGLFTLVSAGNYLAEIIEWLGFAMACWSLPALAFAVFAFCNMAPRGYQHHLWYLEKFGDQYPKHRTAVVPFLW